MATPIDAVRAIHNAFRQDIKLIDAAALDAARGKPGLEATVERVEEATYEIPFLSQAHPEEGEQTIWTRAGIKLPVTPGTYRAVLEEFEYVTRDSDVPERSPSNEDFAPYVDTATGQRLIHTDIIAL